MSAAGRQAHATHGADNHYAQSLTFSSPLGQAPESGQVEAGQPPESDLCLGSTRGILRKRPSASVLPPSSWNASYASNLPESSTVPHTPLELYSSSSSPLNGIKPLHSGLPSHSHHRATLNRDQPTGKLERLGVWLDSDYGIDTNRLVESSLLVCAALGVGYALHSTHVPALQRPAYALLEQVAITITLGPILRWSSRFIPFPQEEKRDGPVPSSTTTTPSSENSPRIFRRTSNRHRPDASQPSHTRSNPDLRSSTTPDPQAESLL